MDPVSVFRHREWLVALLVPLALLWWTWRRRGAALVLPVDHAERPARPWTQGLLRCAESLPALALALAVLLLAGPQSWGAPRDKRQLSNIQFCVDVSGSMTAGFGSGTRYDASMEAINGFLDYREGDAFGLTFFGNAVLHWVPLTTDVSAFRCAPPFMTPGRIPYWFGGTEIGKALLACQDVLVQREEGDRMIILISDGYSADLSGGRDQEIARSLAEDGIIVYAVHISTGSVPDAVVRIAAQTGGEVFSPEDTAGLEAIFATIDQMAKAKIEKSLLEAADDYRPYSIVGLALLGLLLLASFGLRYTPW